MELVNYYEKSREIFIAGFTLVLTVILKILNLKPVHQFGSAITLGNNFIDQTKGEISGFTYTDQLYMRWCILLIQEKLGLLIIDQPYFKVFRCIV